MPQQLSLDCLGQAACPIVTVRKLKLLHTHHSNRQRHTMPHITSTLIFHTWFNTLPSLQVSMYAAARAAAGLNADSSILSHAKRSRELKLQLASSHLPSSSKASDLLVVSDTA